MTTQPNNQRIMSIADLLCHMRQKIIDARAEKDREKLRSLWEAIDVILDSAYHFQDKKVGALLEDMGDSIRDSLMNVEWKSTIPSINDIRELEERDSGYK